MNSELEKRALLVNLSVSLPSLSKTDKQATKTVEETYQVSKTGRYSKLLFPTVDKLKIYDHASKIRNDHYKETLEWLPSARILPTRKYLDYSKLMNQHRQDFEHYKSELHTVYPDMITNAQGALGSLFNQQEYPSVDQFLDLFKFDLNFLPFPSAKDFRVDLSDAQLESLRSELETNATRIAYAAIAKKLHGVISHMADKLRGDQIFRDSLVDNIEEAINLCESLVVPGSSLAGLLEETQKLLVSPKDLRSDESIKADVQMEATKLASRYAEFLK